MSSDPGIVCRLAPVGSEDVQVFRPDHGGAYGCKAIKVGPSLVLRAPGGGALSHEVKSLGEIGLGSAPLI
jgi:hypothetical protein